MKFNDESNLSILNRSVMKKNSLKSRILRNIILSLFMLFFIPITAQVKEDVSISGTIIDQTGNPLPGVSVVIEGTNSGTISDVNGLFSIKAPTGSTLTLSFIGMESVTYRVTSPDNDLSITMVDQLTNLDVIVVTGYSSEKKKDLTGAVSVVDVDMIQKAGTPNVLQSLQGTTPGVNIITDGAPGGSNTQIRIRGMSTVNSNQPLYVIDGVPTTENMSSINPNDIESLQVLKDASSASIYGARAANGVIVITTKKGKQGKLNIEFDASSSLQTIAKTFDVLSSDQWGQAYFAAQKNDGTTVGHPFYGYESESNPVQFLDADNLVPYSNTDWQNEIYSSSWNQKYALTISNGTEKGSMLFSTSYVNQDGLIDQSFYKRFSARLNSTYNIFDKVTIGENLMLAQWTDRGVTTQDDRGVTYNAMRQHPAIPVKDQNGDFTNPLTIASSDIANPVHELYNNRDDKNQSWRIFGNAFIEIKPIKDLSIKSNIGIEHVQFFTNDFTRKLQTSDINSVYRGYGQGDTWTWTNTAMYGKKLNDHNFNILLGTEAITYKYEGLSGSGQGYSFDDENFMVLDAASGVRSSGGGITEWGLYSLFGKANYNFKDKYLVSATLRRDATSRLSSDNNSGVFPAFTGAWRITEEDFFPQTNWLSYLKLRAGWGVNGNTDIDNYVIYSTYVNDAASGISINTTGSPDLKWETTTQTNLGLDMGLFNNSLNITFDYYTKNTEDMLTIPPVLASAGQNAARWTNTGNMENKGFELNIGYNSKMYGDFSWAANVNVSKYKNKLIKLNNLVNYTGSDIRNMEGQPIGVFYGYVTDGIFQNEEEVRNHADQQGKGIGRIKYMDLDNNGFINDDDRTVIGDPNPDLTCGLNLDLNYKRFTLSAFFSSELGFDIFNTTKRQLDFMTYGPVATNRGTSVLDAWSSTNTGSTIPALTLLNTNNETRTSTYFIEDGSYVKLKFLRLNYKFDSLILEKLNLGALSLYVQAENLFTITDYSGLDPEIAPFGGSLRGVDNAPYPISRNFIMGVNIKF